MKPNKKLFKFIGNCYFDEYGGYIWGEQPDGDNQLICQIRGWGAIQQLFRNRQGKINHKEGEKFQDKLGKFIAEAINEKIERESK